MSECSYIFGKIGEQELMLLCRVQDSYNRADAERTVCIKKMPNARRVRSLSRQQALKTGLHDLPLIWKLQVSM